MMLKTRLRPKPFASRVRSAAARRDVAGLVRVVRSAEPCSLSREWARLRPVERVAAFRALEPRAAAKVFADLPAEGKWLAYLGEISEGAAPLLEGARPSAAKLLRRATKRQLNAMRKVLAR
ncbi:MAG: hypothetical protein ACHQ2Z_04355 [Elusimicrobiota bacterium]